MPVTPGNPGRFMTGQRPRITKRVVRGLRTIASLADAAVCSQELKDAPRFVEDEALDAIRWLHRLCDWHDTRQPPRLEKPREDPI